MIYVLHADATSSEKDLRGRHKHRTTLPLKLTTGENIRAIPWGKENATRSIVIMPKNRASPLDKM
jgi:hypothetical protein